MMLSDQGKLEKAKDLFKMFDGNEETFEKYNNENVANILIGIASEIFKGDLKSLRNKNNVKNDKIPPSNIAETTLLIDSEIKSDWS